MQPMQEAAQYVAERTRRRPSVALVLGSGLGDFAETLTDAAVVPYGDIPHFPASTAPGHAGELWVGTCEGKSVAVMRGRFHYYEGYEMADVVAGVRLMRCLGASDIVLTNAAGGICRDFTVGDLMLITDHINLSGVNPLVGPNIDEWGPRFPDMSEVYNRPLRALAHRAAAQSGLTLREGVYGMMSGPSYETPAEIRMMRTIGCDAVGMSTVPEAIVAHHMGMRVLGLSCISNMAAGLLGLPLTHQEVMEAGQMVREKMALWLRTWIAML